MSSDYAFASVADGYVGVPRPTRIHCIPIEEIINIPRQNKITVVVPRFTINTGTLSSNLIVVPTIRRFEYSVIVASPKNHHHQHALHGHDLLD